MQIENSNQGDKCDYCSAPATFKATNASNSKSSISCQLHTKEALESLEDSKK